MKRAQLLAAVCGLIAAPLVWSGAASAATIVVKPGDSIQAAVDAASPGDTIVVRGGVYRGSVLITKDDLTLAGSGAQLEPPATPALSPCADPAHPEETIGLCVFGEFFLSTFTEDVTVTGFTVSGFDAGMVAVGARDALFEGNKVVDNRGAGIVAAESIGTRIVGNEASDDGAYGIFALFSTGTRIAGNVTNGNAEAGIYVGDAPAENAVIAGNRTRDNLFGIFIRNAERGTIADNRIEDNCVGVLFQADAPGPAGAFDLAENRVENNRKACPAGDEAPALSGVGVLLVGAHDVLVDENRIKGNRPSGPTVFSGGVVLVEGLGGTEPTDNIIRENRLKDNAPDLFWDGSGAGNVFSENSCETSEPAGLCGDEDEEDG